MIKGKPMKEMYAINKPRLDYRALTSLNSSMLRLFDSDPVKFFEEFKLGRKRKPKNTLSLLLGDVVDFYLLDCKGDDAEFENRHDEKFALYDTVKGSGQVFTLADVLYEITQEDTNEDGEVGTSFATRFSQAFNRLVDMGKYKGRTEKKALEDFNKNGNEYFKTLLKNTGKLTIDVGVLNKARKIVNLLLEDEFTRDIFTEDEHTEYFSKFPIEWTFHCQNGKGIECKSELDVIRIDHNKKKIYIYDLKTTYDNENFEYSYIKHGYYIQASFYYKAVQKWANAEGMGEYKIIPMEFIVADTSANNRRPVRYRTSIEDMRAGIDGFVLRGVEYKGVNQIVEEILWSEDNDMWNCSKTLFDNEGVMDLHIKYEEKL